jgi:prepilin-type N-terminal cleavage/methylation domain-containing protein
MVSIHNRCKAGAISGRRPRGFTLVELLVVIAIIATLVGLLMPAVQAAREAGRRNTCINNVHQITLAMNGYETAKKSFPGYINLMGTGTSGNYGTTIRPVTWVMSLLPYLERKDLQEEWQTAIDTSLLSSTTFAGKVALAIMKCPSNPGENSESTALSYVVNRGRNGWNKDATVGVCFDLGSTTAAATSNSKVGIDYIGAHDGAANTLLVAESPIAPTGFQADLASTSTGPNPRLYLCRTSNTGGKWLPTHSPEYEYYYRPYPKWDAAPTYRYATTNIITMSELDVAFEWGSLAEGNTFLGLKTRSDAKVTNQIGSLHSGGVIVTGFCDGHTYAMSGDIDVNVFRHLMTPYGKGYSGGDMPIGVVDEGAF